MPVYQIERSFAGLSEEMIEEVSNRALACANRFPGVKWQRSFLNPENKTMSCFYEAPDADSIRRHAELAGMSCESVVRVIEYVARDASPK